MTRVSARVLRNHTRDLLQRAEAGEPIEISVNKRTVAELHRPLSRSLPEEVAVSVVTLAELEIGVLVAALRDRQRLAGLGYVVEEGQAARLEPAGRNALVIHDHGHVTMVITMRNTRRLGRSLSHIARATG